MNEINFTIITVVPTLTAIFWSIIFFILVRWSKNKNNGLFGFIMLVLGLVYIGNAAYFNQQHEFYRHWENVYVTAALSFFPLCYLYVKQSACNEKPVRKDFRTLIPAVSMLVFSLALFFLTSPEEKNSYTRQIVHSSQAPVKWTTLLRLHKIKLLAYSPLLLSSAIVAIIPTRKQIGLLSAKKTSHHARKNRDAPRFKTPRMAVDRYVRVNGCRRHTQSRAESACSRV